MLKNTLFALLFIGLVLTVAFSKKLSEFMVKPSVRPNSSASLSNGKIATVKSVSGDVDLVTQDYSNIKKDQTLANEDRIRVTSGSELVIEMASGHQLKVPQNSEFTVYQWMDKWVFYRHRGTVELLGGKARHPLIVADDQSAQLIDKSDGLLEFQETVPVASTDGLTDEQIQSSLRTLHPQFQRCFLRLVKEGIAKEGRVVLNFQIEPKGKIQKAEATSSSIPDKTFQNCLITVVKRARFPRFEGAPILVTRPMNFR